MFSAFQRMFVRLRCPNRTFAKGSNVFAKRVLFKVFVRLFKRMRSAVQSFNIVQRNFGVSKSFAK